MQSILIISLIVLLVFLISTSIHHLLRFISPSPNPAPPLHHPLSPCHVSSQQHAVVVISPVDAPASSDCAVCLSRFHPHDQLRLLPPCCHAFHSRCIDTWLAFNRTCPLCRSTIDGDKSPPSVGEESVRVEIGSVSRRSSFEYVVDDQVVVGPSGAQTGVAELAGSGKEDGLLQEVGGRGWLKEYADWLVSSASWSRRGGGGGGSVVANSGGGGDIEREGEEGSYFLRWLIGA